MSVEDPTSPDEEDEDRLLVRIEDWLSKRLGKAAPVVPITLFALSWAYLNGVMNTRLWEGDSWALAAVTPSPDVLVVLAVLCGIGFMGKKPRPVFLLLMVFVLFFLRLVHVADEVMLLLWDRPFELYPDSALFWDAVMVVEEQADMGSIITQIAIWSAVLAALAFLARQALMISANFFTGKWQRIGFAVLAVICGGVAALGGPSGDLLAARAVAQVLSKVGAADQEMAKTLQIQAAVNRADAAPETLAGLDLRHVELILVESWSGQAMEARTIGEARVRTAMSELGAALSEDGYHARSTFLAVPDPSGISALAQATVLSGVPIRSHSDMTVLRSTSMPSLAHRFQSTGYRTVRALPGETRERQEHTDSFWGFDLDLYAWRLGYQGPAFGSSTMPDQFVLDRTWQMEMAEAEGPTFLMVALTGSQAPFDRLPPYVLDWESVGDGAVFNDLSAIEREVPLLTLEGGTDAWIAALEHTLRVVRQFLVEVVPDQPGVTQERRRRRRRPHPLFIVMGDHPPPAPVAARSEPSLVPVLAISRDEAVLEPFAQRAWTEGVTPTRTPPLEGTETLVWTLLSAFGQDPEVPSEP